MSTTLTAVAAVSHTSLVRLGRYAVGARIRTLEKALNAVPAKNAGHPRVQGYARQLVRLYCARADLNSRAKGSAR
jgi:hypothetical protein